MNEFRFICARLILILYERVLKILSVTELQINECTIATNADSFVMHAFDGTD